MEHGLKWEKENWRTSVSKGYLGTTSCPRCAGLLVSDWFYDFENPAEYHAEVLRCVQCGNRVDPTIAQNRIRLLVAHDREERIKDQRSANSEHCEDAAVSC
jgi:hypothetical protein